jgi:thioredoxin-related protein
MNQLKAKLTLSCDTCGCAVNRQKTFTVLATSKEAAQVEASKLVSEWKLKFTKVDCAFCKQIKKDLAA